MPARANALRSFAFARRLARLEAGHGDRLADGFAAVDAVFHFGDGDGHVVGRGELQRHTVVGQDGFQLLLGDDLLELRGFVRLHDQVVRGEIGRYAVFRAQMQAVFARRDGGKRDSAGRAIRAEGHLQPAAFRRPIFSGFTSAGVHSRKADAAGRVNLQSKRTVPF